MEEVKEVNELYCGNWEDEMCYLEQSVEWLQKPSNSDKPYSLKRESAVLQHRNVEAFCMVFRAKKMLDKLRKRIQKDRDQLTCLALLATDAENLYERINQLLYKHRQTTLVKYPVAPAPTVQIPNPAPLDIMALQRDVQLDCLMSVAEKINTGYLVHEFFDMMNKMQAEIHDHLYSTISPEKAHHLYEERKEQIAYSYISEHLEKQEQYMDEHLPEDATADDLTLEDNMNILLLLREEYKKLVFGHSKWGKQLKQLRRQGLDDITLIASLYHVMGNSYFIDNYIKLQLNENKIKIVETFIRDQKEKQTPLPEPPAEDTTATEAEQPEKDDAPAKAKSYQEKLQAAYDKVSKSEYKKIGFAVLLAVLCARRYIEEGKPLFRKNQDKEIIETVPDFTYWLMNNVEGFAPDDKELKEIHKTINEFIKVKDESIDYFTLNKKDDLATFIVAHYKNPHDERCTKMKDFAAEVYNLL